MSENVQGVIPNRAPYAPKMYATIFKPLEIKRTTRQRPQKISQNAEQVAGYIPNRAPYDPKNTTTGITSQDSAENFEASLSLRKSLRNDITTARMGEAQDLAKRAKNFAPIIESINNLGITNTINAASAPRDIAAAIIKRVQEAVPPRATRAQFDKLLPDIMKQVADDLKAQLRAGQLPPDMAGDIIKAIQTGPLVVPPAPPLPADPVEDLALRITNIVKAARDADDPLILSRSVPISLDDARARIESDIEPEDIARELTGLLPDIFYENVINDVEVGDLSKISDYTDAIIALGPHAIKTTVERYNDEAAKTRRTPLFDPNLANVDAWKEAVGATIGDPFTVAVDDMSGLLRAKDADKALEKYGFPVDNFNDFAELAETEAEIRRTATDIINALPDIRAGAFTAAVDAENWDAASESAKKTAKMGTYISEGTRNILNEGLTRRGLPLTISRGFTNVDRVLGEIQSGEVARRLLAGLPEPAPAGEPQPLVAVPDAAGEIILVGKAFEYVFKPDNKVILTNKAKKGSFTTNKNFPATVFVALARFLSSGEFEPLNDAAKAVNITNRQRAAANQLAEYLSNEYKANPDAFKGEDGAKQFLAERKMIGEGRGKRGKFRDIGQEIRAHLHEMNMRGIISDAQLWRARDRSKVDFPPTIAELTGRRAIQELGNVVREDNSDEEFNADSLRLDADLMKGKISDKQYVAGQKKLGANFLRKNDKRLRGLL